MKKLFIKTGAFICRIVDFFYPPFKKYMSPELFRYGAVGGINLLFDWVLYFIVFNFILHQQDLVFGSFSIRSDLSAFIIKFPITLISGFLMQKYVTFSLSTSTKGRVQLVRYFMVVLVNVFINIAGFHFFVGYLHFWPSITNAVISIIATIFSYFAQKRFTFRNKKV